MYIIIIMIMLLYQRSTKRDYFLCIFFKNARKKMKKKWKRLNIFIWNDWEIQKGRGGQPYREHIFFNTHKHTQIFMFCKT